MHYVKLEKKDNNKKQREYETKTIEFSEHETIIVKPKNTTRLPKQKK